MLLKRICKATGITALCLAASVMSAQAATVSLVDNFTGSEAVEVDVTLANEGAGVRVTLDLITTNTGNIADLRGFFFELDGFSDSNTYTVTGTDVTGIQFGSNSVINLGGGNNLNGGGNDPYDIGIEIGSSGIGTDDIQSTNFLVELVGGTLTEDDFFGQRMGARATSTGPVGSARDGSSKVRGEFPSFNNPPGVVPLPASSLLLLGGLGVFAVMRRRRRTA